MEKNSKKVCEQKRFKKIHVPSESLKDNFVQTDWLVGLLAVGLVSLQLRWIHDEIWDIHSRAEHVDSAFNSLRTGRIEILGKLII